MAAVEAVDEAILESVVSHDCFADPPDLRQLIKVIHPLVEILSLSLLAVMAGAEAFTGSISGRRSSIRRGASGLLPMGTADHDRVGEVFAALDAEQFPKCFTGWAAGLTGVPEGVIAINGKTSRRPCQKKGGRNPIHMVSALAARQRLMLGRVKVA